MPQLEQLKWQSRQHQKRAEDLGMSGQEVAKVWGRWGEVWGGCVGGGRQ